MGGSTEIALRNSESDNFNGMGWMLRTGHGSAYIKTKNGEDMRRILLRVVLDKSVTSLKFELADESSRIRQFYRPTNNLNGNSRRESPIGGLVETAVELPRTAYVSSISIIIGNVKVRENAVMMGLRIYEGGTTIDNQGAYNGEQYWDEH